MFPYEIYKLYNVDKSLIGMGNIYKLKDHRAILRALMQNIQCANNFPVYKVKSVRTSV